ncbi:MAG: hypothetical protein ACYTEZ_08510 [Planctomycetota bacterium]
MKTSPRPELKDPVLALAAKLQGSPDAIPLTDLARLFGADASVLERVESRGSLVLKGDTFSNDGPELVVPAGQVELEIPILLRGTWAAGPDSFTLTFPSADFTVRACARIAFLRKCFDLREIRATPRDLTLDFGGSLADRRYTF